MSYEYWKSALAGEKPKMFVDDPQCGFYRKGIYERNDKGNKRRIGWEPVAVFMAGETMTGRTASRDVTGDALNELWSYIAGNPISEEAYRAVAERGERWPDDPAPPEAMRPHGDALDGLGSDGKYETEPAIGHNNPPEVLPEVAHATAIKNAIGASKDLKATTEAEAAIALGAANRIRELRLDAEKAAKRRVTPLQIAYETEREKWAAMIKNAKAEQDRLDNIVKAFREAERKRIAAEQAAAAAKQREAEEAAERAAQRSIAAGELEAPPIVEPDPVPMQAAPLVATYGTRRIKEEEKFFLDEITSYDDVYKHFREAEPMKAFLKLMAGQAVKRGEVVPGTKTHKGLI